MHSFYAPYPYVWPRMSKCLLQVSKCFITGFGIVLRAQEQARDTFERGDTCQAQLYPNLVPLVAFSSPPAPLGRSLPGKGRK